MDKNNINIIHGRIVRQNSQEFILSVFTIKQILKFTKYTERLIVGFDENDLPIYNDHIQRLVENGRVDRIADFLINDPLATFPTNIVLGIPNPIIEEQKVTDELFYQIKLNDRVFSEINKKLGDVFITIIDGQHRIRGIEIAIERLKQDILSLERTNRVSASPELQRKFNIATKRLRDLESIELAVSFFIDPSLEYQAMVFSTINRTQKRVSQNLVNSLFGLDTNDTPQKTALETTLSLNSHPNSPFYKRINLYGGCYEKNQSPPLSQATMIRSIVNLISENSREAELDRFKKRSELLKRSEKSKRFLPFRLFYAQDRDSLISDTLFYFFSAVKYTFIDLNGNSYWDIRDNNLSNILQTTVGYDALLLLLCDILKESDYKSKNEILGTTEFYSKFLLLAKRIDFANREKYPFSTKGKNILYLEMSLSIFPEGTFEQDDRLKKLDEALNNYYE